MIHRTLLINSGFEPLRIMSWQRAFVLFFQGKVEILEEYSAFIHTVSQKYRIPAVVRLIRWIKLKRQPPIIRFSRTNLYLRDNYQCQYCQKHFVERELTLDHVVPVVRGGKKTWENIVTACIRCNQRKGHRTLDESGLKLIHRPLIPRWLPGTVGVIKAQTPPPIWQPYLTFPDQIPN